MWHILTYRLGKCANLDDAAVNILLLWATKAVIVERVAKLFNAWNLVAC